MALCVALAVAAVACGSDDSGDAIPVADPETGTTQSTASTVLDDAVTTDDDGSSEGGSAAGDQEPADLPSCTDSRVAVVTDIDETLTVSNLEILTQLGDLSYVPEQRPDASATMAAFADRGYWVVYITARAETLEVEGTPMREITEEWLIGQDFPFDERTQLHLAPDLEGTMDAANTKAAVLEDLMADGFEIAWAYGDADSDFEAWSVVPVPQEQNFSIGELAGYEGTTGITAPGYTEHLADVVEPLTPVCADT